MPITIRAAEASDLPAILALLAQHAMDDGAVLPPERAAAIFERIASYPDYHLYIARHRGHTVGSYALLIMDNLGHRGAPSAIIESVVVEPACQGQGIGRRMMDHALGIARARGCYKAVLSSNLKRDRAHRFYESLGFERHGHSYRLHLDASDQGENMS